MESHRIGGLKRLHSALGLFATVTLMMFFVVSCGGGTGDDSGAADVVSAEDVPVIADGTSPLDSAAADSAIADAGSPDDVTPDILTPDILTPDILTPDILTPDIAADESTPPDDVSVVDPCDPNLCVSPNRGLCEPDEGADGYVCLCDPGYTENEGGDCVLDTTPCGEDADCADGVFCNGDERCASGEAGADVRGCVAAAEPRDVDDGDPCTDDRCDENNDQIVHEAVLCPDNAHCDGGRCVCDPGYSANAFGTCLADGSCDPDRQEENDTAQTAGAIQLAAGSLLSATTDDADWFSIPICVGGELIVDVYFDGEQGDINASLFAPDGVSVLAVGDSQTSDETITWTSTEAESVLLQIVVVGDACVGYSLGYQISGCGGCADDAFEINDTRSRAFELDQVTTQPLIISDSSTDWYWLRTCDGQEISYTATFDDADGALSMALYHENDSEPLVTSVPTDGGQILQWASELEGLLYIEVSTTTEDACFSYTIAGDTTACSGGACDNDVLEDNDSAQNPSMLDNALSYQLGVSAGDDDWMLTSVGSGESMLVFIEYNDAAGDAYVELYDATGTELLASSSSDVAMLSWTAMEDRDVLFRVWTDVDVCIAYTIRVERTGSQSCDEDVLEENDDPQHATTLTTDGNASARACGGDLDWFALNLCGGASVDMYIFPPSDEGELSVTLLAPDTTTVVATATRDGEGSMSLEAGMLDAGLYYVRVEATADAEEPGVPYQIGYSMTCCEPDAYEPNDSFSVATPMGDVADDATLKIAPGQEDWFAITVCADALVQPQLDFTQAQNDIDIFLYAADGVTELASGVSHDDNETLSWTASGDGTVYLRVLGGDGVCSDYGFSWPEGKPDCSEKK